MHEAVDENEVVEYSTTYKKAAIHLYDKTKTLRYVIKCKPLGKIGSVLRCRVAVVVVVQILQNSLNYGANENPRQRKDTYSYFSSIQTTLYFVHS